MPSRRLLLSLVALSTACTKSSALYCDEDTPCADGQTCDLLGEYAESGHIRNTCIPYPWDASVPDATPVSCGAPDTALRCEGDELVSCGSDSIEKRESCPLGCLATAIRCAQLVPSNGLGELVAQAGVGPDVIWTEAATITTDTGAVRVGSDSVDVPSVLLAAPPDGVPIRALLVRSFDANRVTVLGASTSTALAIVATGPIVLRDVVSVAGQNPANLNGSFGASAPCAGKNAPSVSQNGTQVPGASGGGHANQGGSGGDVDSVATGPIGGARFDNPDLVPLRGGCQGGNGGGFGGGALQLVSLESITLSGAAFINANGGGGDSNEGSQISTGGGSGGGVLLEAPVVSLQTGTAITANGGGGGCAGELAGDLVVPSATPSSGAICSGNAASGGAGGALGVFPEPGDSIVFLSGTSRSGGSGGGSAGYIRINTLDGTVAISAGVILSPAPTTATVVTN